MALLFEAGMIQPEQHTCLTIAYLLRHLKGQAPKMVWNGFSMLAIRSPCGEFFLCMLYDF